MSSRLSRAEQNDRNRTLLLAAARRVFLARGYYAATLEQIADEAGFSKGVVYSRFASKADMFLALLDLAQQAERAAPGWRLLVTEFRVHAARDPELNRRYAALHARTVEGIARALVSISEGAGETLASPPRQLAELVLAIETGLALEQSANPDALGGPDLPVLRRLNIWLASAPVTTREET
jgi:AcrR family transcriptional regulator